MLGVLGGMGPLATVDFMKKLVAETRVATDQCHIPTVVWSVPQVADRSQYIMQQGESPYPGLLNGVFKLKSLGAIVIAIPCNTAHYWADELMQHSGIMILHIADAVMNQIKRRLPQGGKVGLLATTGTLRAQIYQNRVLLDADKWQLVLPDDYNQSLLMQGIREAKSGKVDSARNIFQQQVKVLKAAGAELVILGCTELPSVLDQDPYLIDSNLALARRCTEWHRANYAGVV
ncbi:MAG: aspartate/glutamate racemase family protein [Arenicella sp.]